MGRKSLDEILDDGRQLEAFDEPATEQKEPEAAPEPEQVEAAETPQEEKGVEKPSEPPSDQLPKDVYAPLKAVRDENKELKAQIEALNKKMEESEPEKPAPSLWEDDQAWQQHFGGQVVTQAVTQSTMQNKIQVSEMLARRDHEDFEQMKEVFSGLEKENPALTQEVLADPDPWGRAYKIAKNHSTMKELGATDVTQLESKIREKVLAEAQEKAPVAAPKTLSDKPSVGGADRACLGRPNATGGLNRLITIAPL